MKGGAAEFENALAIVNVGRIEIVVPDPCLLEIGQCVEKGFDQNYYLAFGEVHRGVVTALHNFG